MDGTGIPLAGVSIILLLGVAALAIALFKTRSRLDSAKHIAESATAVANESQQRLAQAEESLRKLQSSLGALESAHEALRSTSTAKLAKAMADFDQLKAQAVARLRAMTAEIEKLRASNAALVKWQPIVDVEAKAQELLREAQKEVERLQIAARAELSAARSKVAEIQIEGRRQAAEFEGEAQRRLQELDGKLAARETAARQGLEEELQHVKANVIAARKHAEIILARAQESAKATAGEAWDAKQNLDRLQRLAAAIENQISGYGTKYLVPIRSVLDELGVEMAHTDAGQGLKTARAATRALVESDAAATCDYSEEGRRSTALQFVLEAFNGKVDAILAKVRAENAGTLQQQVRDAFEIVNHLGAAFRNARIQPKYLEARLDEVRWAALAQHAKAQQKEEQRRLKEEMREEAKAQREYEKAIKAAERKEAELAAERKRIEAERAQAAAEERARQEARLVEELKRASESQRAELEARFREEARLREEQVQREFDQQVSEMERELESLRETRERTKSMAEQVKYGKVYVISNIGSFGERVFKVGQTRRKEWQERIDELGDASVPFAFDVHAVIEADNAPRLEGAIHAKLVEYQVNKMNWRKEFFRVDLATIRKVVEGLGVAAEWTMEAAAEDYRNTLALEARMADDPAERERWIQEQLGIEFEAAPQANGDLRIEDPVIA
jgi:chromosome segregation ATPase